MKQVTKKPASSVSGPDTVHVLDKDKTKAQILNSEVNILGLITNGIVHRTPKQTTLRLIKKELLTLQNKERLSDREINHLWDNSYRIYLNTARKTYANLRRADMKFGKKEDYEQNLAARMQEVYNTVHKDVIQSENLVKTANSVANDVEFWHKHDEIYGNDGILSQKSPFFLASSHEKPAKDHKDWEGKLYYDEDYPSYCTDSEQERIEKIIRQRDLHSVQWVVGEPVYLVTRPNCKHFFIPVSVSEAETYSDKSLLKNKKGYMNEELPKSYEESVLERLKVRLDTEMQLSKTIKSEELNQNIEKHKVQYRVWTRRASRSKSRAKMKTVSKK